MVGVTTRALFSLIIILHQRHKENLTRLPKLTARLKHFQITARLPACPPAGMLVDTFARLDWLDGR